MPLKYTQPNIDALDKALSGQYADLKSFVLWYEDPKTGRKPTSAKTPMNDPSTHLTWPEAIAKNQPIGLAMSPDHPIIALDIDNVDPKTVLPDHPSYEEASPSGKQFRRRRLYKLSHPLEKQQFSNQPKQKYTASSEVALYSTTGYVTLTGAECNDLPIATIDPTDILTQFPNFKKAEKIVPLSEGLSGPAIDRAGLTPPEVWVQQVSCDETNPIVQRIMLDEGLNFYDYWVMGLMCLHITQGPSLGYAYAQQWSQSDPRYWEYPDADKNLDDTWMSLGNKGITRRTYQWMFQQFKIEWPVMSDKGVPVHSEISNFEALMERYQLTLQVDAITKTLYLEGPPSSLYPTFYDDLEMMHSTRDSDLPRLAAKFVPLTRAFGFRPSYHQIQDFLRFMSASIAPKDQTSRFADAVKNTPLPKKDLIKLISRKVLIRNPDMAPSQEEHDYLVRKWLLSVGRSLWPEDMPYKFRGQAAEGVLLLSSPKGGIGKSTFGRKLFPDTWKHLYTSTRPQFGRSSSDKDYKLITCTSLIVDFDEGERVLNTNKEADIKAEITATEDVFRPPYGIDSQTHPRRYSILLSTNETSLQIPREGARRYWWLNIDDIDLDLMDEIDMMQLWAQVRQELMKDSDYTPWHLTTEERKALVTRLVPHRVENSYELILNEFYDFSPEGYAAMVDKIPEYKQVGDVPVVKQVTHGLCDVGRTIGVDHVSNQAGLKRAIKHMLKKHAPENVMVKRTHIKNGEFMWRGQIRYFLPFPRNLQ